MLELVTPEDVRDHLQIDNDAYDRWMAIWIPAVSAAVASWLKDPWRLYMVARDAQGNILEDSAGEPIVLDDSSGDPIVNPTVQAATLIELAQQRRFTDGSGAAAVPATAGHGYVLGAGATSLLNALRKSTVA
ncbi:MAG: hypothetical protein V4718_04465 [Pseudomonadota bacterium]